MNADVAIAKLELGPRDVLLVTVPDRWTYEFVEQFCTWFSKVYQPIMNGAELMVISDAMSVDVVRHEDAHVTVGMHH